MTPVPAEWWLRPVSRAARVGEQRAVVWKRVYRKPIFARRSRFGVGTCPPNVPHCPNPASSIRMIRTLGAPAGALVMVSFPGVESLYVRPILASLNASSGFGNTPCATTKEAARQAATAARESLFAFISIFLSWCFVLVYFSSTVTLFSLPLNLNGGV